MSARRYRTRRRLSQDLLPLVAVASLALGVLSLFPPGVLSVRPVASEAATAAGCAFVTLSAEEAAAAWTAARTSWQARTRLSRRAVEMLPRALPETPPAEIVPLAARSLAPGVSRVVPAVAVLPPTEAAPAPANLGRAPAAAPRAAFPRETMLRLH